MQHVLLQGCMIINIEILFFYVGKGSSSDRKGTQEWRWAEEGILFLKTFFSTSTSQEFGSQFQYKPYLNHIAKKNIWNAYNQTSALA